MLCKGTCHALVTAVVRCTTCPWRTLFSGPNGSGLKKINKWIIKNTKNHPELGEILDVHFFPACDIFITTHTHMCYASHHSGCSTLTFVSSMNKCNFVFSGKPSVRIYRSCQMDEWLFLWDFEFVTAWLQGETVLTGLFFLSFFLGFRWSLWKSQGWDVKTSCWNWRTLG